MKSKKIVFLSILIIIVFSCNSVYAKYVYHFNEEISKFSRDSSSPICNVTYSTTKWTNLNVTVRLESNKKLEPINGFTMIDNGTIFEKVLTHNETKTFKVYDYSGNNSEVTYSVENIDKELPQIIGCENYKTYQSPLELDYYDNVEIKEILVDKYDDKLEVEYTFFYHDSYTYLGIDRTKSTINIRIKAHPLNTKKYKIYLDNNLYAVTEEKKFVITNLESGNFYNIKVEAIDKYGNILDEYSFVGSTGYYENISSSKIFSHFEAEITGIDPKVQKIKYCVMNYYDQENKFWYEPVIANDSVRIVFLNYDTKNYSSYTVYLYMYDIFGNLLDTVGFAIDFNASYVEESYDIDPYKLVKSGNYQIYVEDLAGNNLTYFIKVKK